MPNGNVQKPVRIRQGFGRPSVQVLSCNDNHAALAARTVRVTCSAVQYHGVGQQGDMRDDSDERNAR